MNFPGIPLPNLCKIAHSLQFFAAAAWHSALAGVFGEHDWKTSLANLKRL
jgi:hypothetical protein